MNSTASTRAFLRSQPTTLTGVTPAWFLNPSQMVSSCKFSCNVKFIHTQPLVDHLVPLLPGPMTFHPFPV